jgi:hypothetical protein
LQGFSFSNFDTIRQRYIVTNFLVMAIAKIGIAGILFLINPFLGIWVGSAGLALGGLAGGIRLMPTFGGKASKCFQNTGLRLKLFRQVRISNRARTARSSRSASRPAFTNASGGDDSGGDSESDSGDSSDQPGLNLSFHVTPFQELYRKLNSFLSLRRLSCDLGCWRLPCHQCPTKGVLS